MKLVYHDGKEARVGDIVQPFGDWSAVIKDILPPEHLGSAGRVYVQALDGQTDRPFGGWTLLYPYVIGARWTGLLPDLGVEPRAYHHRIR